MVERAWFKGNARVQGFVRAAKCAVAWHGRGGTKINRIPNLTLFDPYLRRWNAQAAGDPFATDTSDLLPVSLGGKQEGLSAMIKITHDSDERIGGQVLQWWQGDGAARVYAWDLATGTLLMERALGARHLLHMAQEGDDDAATRAMCRTIHRLHAKRLSPPPDQLLSLAQREGGLMAECATLADTLLRDQREQVVLHGDAYHSNILDFEQRGWLAIDPKRVTGERYYDYVHVLCNPDLAECSDPARFARQLGVILQATGLERERLLKWVMAHAALSAAWFLEDGERSMADAELTIAHLARQARA